MKGFSKGKKEKRRTKDKSLAMRVSCLSIFINVILSAVKLAAGIAAGSGAMVSDAVHTASDVFSTLIVIAGVKLAGKKSDKEHPYGHERMECVASVLLSVTLMLTGMGIGLDGISKIALGNKAIKAPGMAALIAALLSVGVKEWMYWYTRAAAKKIRSGALMADAWHHRSDALSSVGAFLGISGARLGFPVLDPLASVVICIFIGKASIDVFRDAMDKMVDKACDDETVEEIKDAAMAVSGVKRIDEIRTRMFGSRVYVDIEIAAEGTLNLIQSHEIAENVHLSIERHFPHVKHCMVHVNPMIPEEVEKEETASI